METDRADRTNRVFNAVGATLTGVLDFLLPPRCLTCDTMTSRGQALCASCWPRMQHLERPWCLRYGTPFDHDAGVDALSPRAIADPPVFERSRAVCRYSGPARDLVLGLKFARRRELAGPMGLWMARAGAELLQDGPLLVPVPLHRRRLLQRRFNQSADLAKAVAAHSAGDFSPQVLQRTRRTRAQVGLTAKQRQKNLRGAIALGDQALHLVQGRPVVLIDDVLTTGATVEVCTKVLKRAGAAQVDVLVFAMADLDGALEPASEV